MWMTTTTTTLIVSSPESHVAVLVLMSVFQTDLVPQADVRRSILSNLQFAELTRSRNYWVQMLRQPISPTSLLSSNPGT